MIALRILDAALDFLSLAVLVTLASFALAVVRDEPRPLRERDPDRAVELLKTADSVWSESGVVYAFARDSTARIVSSPITPSLVRRLTRAGIGVESRPDFPGRSPTILLVLVGLAVLSLTALRRRSPLFEKKRRRELRLGMVVAGVTVIYVVNWAQGAYVDTSTSGIYRQAIEGVPPSFLEDPLLRTAVDDAEWEARSAPPELRDAARSAWLRIEMLRENYLAHSDQNLWMTFDQPLRWLLGLILIGLFTRRTQAAEGPARGVWLGLYFVVLIALISPFVVDRWMRSGPSPAAFYWAWFLGSLMLCWQGCLRASKVTPNPSVKRSSLATPGPLPG